MTCEEERWFSLWGPSSGGGESVLIRGGRVFVVAYGDATPEGTEQRREYTPAEFARTHASVRNAAPAIAWLRERGLLEGPPPPA